MIIRVRVKPNSKVDSILISENDELQVRICGIPVDGKANKYLITYLSKVFKVSKSSVIILKGLNTSYKRIEIMAEDHHIKNILSSLEQNTP